MPEEGGMLKFLIDRRISLRLTNPLTEYCSHRLKNPGTQPSAHLAPPPTPAEPTVPHCTDLQGKDMGEVRGEVWEKG